MKKISLSMLALLCATTTMAQRQEVNIGEGWQFSRDKAQWSEVSIPHDWAIGGPFDKKWDLQYVAIEQNGEKEKSEKSGRSGSLPWIGEGHYKTTLSIPKGYSHAELIFDGAMAEPKVSVNGKQAGYWAYGYNAFKVDITPYVNMKKGGSCSLEVDLANVEESSRWYPGGGIYRPVKLVLTGDARLATWETFARTDSLAGARATVRIDTRVEGTVRKGMAVEFELKDCCGNVVASATSAIGANGEAGATMDLAYARLWTPETPYLYKMTTRLVNGKRTIDSLTEDFGVRTVKVNADGGFMLNGVTRKIKGVCLHHDLGPLGAAVNKAAIIRQIKMMKAMGCDAIRTSHNMPSQMQMQVCDSLGMMVMAESFDMWIYPKCKNGYARFFKEWSDRDIENLVKNHRNHPSIVMWSIGNEIPEQWSQEGVDISKRLQDVCHKFDPTRPVTQGMDKAEAAIKSGFAQVMDVAGFNYRVHKYKNSIKSLPQGFLLGSETASTVSSRGVYKFPVVVTDHAEYPDGQCSSYDTEYCSWSNLPDDDWRMQDDYSWVIGEFVWTGYDYLGEPTPYDTYWPSRSSYFGICDLAGLPKDRYYLYRSKWNKQSHTVYLLPHWTWQGREGEVTPVYCYTDGVEGELFVNGKSQGRIRKNSASRLDRYRLRWNDVKYEPGEIKVIAYDELGNKIGEDVRRTAGDPSQLDLKAEYTDGKSLKANGEDLAFITVSMLDKDGNLCPTASDNLTFEVSGNGKFEAACNGDATSLQPFTNPEMKLFSGQLVVVVRSSKSAGALTLKVNDQERGISKELTIKSEE